MSGSIVEPHDKMRARDVNRVAKGEQAPRPPKDHPDVSRPPPPTSVKAPEDKAKEKVKENLTDEFKRCYSLYLEYLSCIKQKGDAASECDKLMNYCRSVCPSEWIERWNEERKCGVIHSPIFLKLIIESNKS